MMLMWPTVPPPPLTDPWACKQSDSRGLVALSTWELGGSAMAKFLEGEGRHALQKECRHGRSWGSRLGKFRWQTGHVSRRLAPLARGFSPRACLLSASFSTAQAAASPVSRLSTRPSISSTFSLRGFDPPPYTCGPTRCAREQSPSPPLFYYTRAWMRRAYLLSPAFPLLTLPRCVPPPPPFFVSSSNTARGESAKERAR